MDVSAIKLSSGEVIYGVIESSNAKITLVNNPMIPETRRQSDGSAAMVLNRFIPMMKDERVGFNTSMIVAVGFVTDSLANYYRLSVAYAEFADEAFDTNVNLASNHLKEIIDGMSTSYEEPSEDMYKSFLESIKPNGKFQ